jgi:uncharacterized protein (DUF2141 family)
LEQGLGESGHECKRPGAFFGVIEAMTKWPKTMIALGSSIATLIVLTTSAGATDPLGPNPTLCANGSEPSILVKITGLKHRNGTIRVRAFTGDPNTYFNKKHAYRRVQYALPSSGPVEVCVPVGAPGLYAIDVRHDANGNGDTDRSDGVGASGNPKFSLFNVIFGRRPPAQQVQVNVGNGTSVVPVTVRYL